MPHFCPRCAARLPGPPPVRCAGCGYAQYVNAKPCAGVMVVRHSTPGLEFLAARRAHEPSQGLWDLPGGFCDGWEHPADAAVREAREEVGIEVRLGPLIGLYVGDYRHQGETLPVLDAYYFAEQLDGEPKPDPAEVSEVAWFPIVAPPPLAFPNMDAVVADAVQQLAEGRWRPR